MTERGVAAVVTPRVPANAAMLIWARDRLGMTTEEAAHAINISEARLQTWETPGRKAPKDYPTLAQLRTVAAKYRQTLAFFLLEEPPAVEDATRPPDFRRRRPDDRLPLRVLAELDKAAERRAVFVDLADPEPADLPYSPLSDLQSATTVLRDRLGVTLRDQLGWKRQHAFRNWVEHLEHVGVLVFQMSRVEPDDTQGFSLYYPQAPVVVLNGADSPETRTFTLFHELAHLLTRSGGVCQTSRHNKIEQRCNEFAAEFLMPQADFVRAVHSGDKVAQIPDLANRYRVSQSAIAVRLRTLDYINQDTLDDLLETAAEYARRHREEVRERGRATKGGPPHHLTQLRNLGARYVYTVLDAVEDQRISPVDASYFLDSKWSTIRGMETDLLDRRAADA